SRAGITIIQKCRKYFDTTKYQRQSAVLNDTVENTLLLNSKTEIIQAQLQPLDVLLFSDASSPSITIQLSDVTDTLPPETSPQTLRELAHLLNTPNKRPIENEELWNYTQNNFVICAFAFTAKELETKIDIEFTKELSSICDRNPVVWNSALEEYINTTLKESGEKFKNAIRNKYYKDIDEDVGPTMDRKMSGRKHIVYQVSALLKFYERTFLTLDIDWIESHFHPAKMMKSGSNSGIVLVDAKVTRFSDGLDVWHLEVAGPPYNVPNKHVIDSRLTLYSLNILPDGRFLSCELATAVIPFSLNRRHQYKSVLRMMSIFHDELIKQDELLEEINRSILRSENITVRQVLKIPRL
ncbi:1580_t:CDS:2, partial [Diversispora eburnea]